MNGIDLDVIHRLVERVEHEHSTMGALEALGYLKMWARDREIQLVQQARRESQTWVLIGEALQRDPADVGFLYGRGTDAP